MTLPRTMRAWRVEELSDAGTKQLRDVELPVPSPDQHLLRVEAAGLAFGDTLIVRGRYQVKPPLPFTPGSDVVGHSVADDALAGDWVGALRAAAPGGVDVVFDPVGGETGAQSLRWPRWRAGTLSARSGWIWAWVPEPRSCPTDTIS